MEALETTADEEQVTEQETGQKKGRSPWLWVPSLYFAEGIPYIVVMTVSVIFYKRMGISNAEIALYTSWLYLPWVIKPLWSPVVEIIKTKRMWIVLMQLVIGAALASMALAIPLPNFFKVTLAILWLLAFSSATHDIAADGFYMLGLSQHQQAWFVGIRSTFYRFAMLTGQGLLVIVAGYIESHTGLRPVEVPVVATRAGAEVVWADSTVAPAEGQLRIIVRPDTLAIGLQARTPAEVNELIARARQWNARRQPRASAVAEQCQAARAQHTTWWQRHVARRVAAAFVAVFGSRSSGQSGQTVAGNVGLIWLHLSSPPPAGKSVVVHFGREGGDKSIALVEGGRFEFTSDNWAQPAVAVIQLDPKLRTTSSARFMARAGNVRLSWTLTFAGLGALFLLFMVYHRFVLPYPKADVPRRTGGLKPFFANFARTFASFFTKKQIGIALALLLLYRLAEAQLVKIASPFLLDSQEAGGLALTTGQVGFVYGTVGLLALSLGGILGGFLVARDGLKKWILPMVLAINVPDVAYVYLSHYLPDNFLLINLCVATEQFGYGFGYTAYMLYMIYIADGEYKTAHFAIATGFMALGMMLPGMISGWIQELIGYEKFFLWVLLCTIPGFIIVKLLPLDPEFGKKRDEKT
ncbi:MAG: MFS transporter [bacterium]|nr:MFS transporter [candidate division KSB1 bacterium]MDH7560649.1 MFS transporter [bacterium]